MDDSDLQEVKITPKVSETSQFNSTASSLVSTPASSSTTFSNKTASDSTDNAGGTKGSASSSSLARNKSPPPALVSPKESYNVDPTNIKSPDFGSFDSDGLILAVLVVNFDHLQGPVIEFSYPENILSSPNLDPEIVRLLPFLALPDGAHLSDEDYSYFHLVSKLEEGKEALREEDEPFPINKTVFGISCNRQLAASELLNRGADITRSTVQKAVIVLARQPVFGPIRDKLGVITRAFFHQRDFESKEILVEFYNSLQIALKGQKVSEQTMHMGTSLRELVHKFRHKTLMLLKLLLLQKRIMFFGYPVERLCTYQYSLISLIPGLLMNLSDCGASSLDTAARALQTPTSLKTSDRSSLLAYMGLPIHIFGKDSFFQPYLPLQNIDTLKQGSWLVGTTNSIIIQQRDPLYDCLVHIEQTTFTFNDPKLERLVALTPADRKWMDDIVHTVESTWVSDDPTRPQGMSFNGSDDFLRAKFEEYLCSVLSSMKLTDYLTKAAKNDLVVSGGSSAAHTAAQFSGPWLTALRQTPAIQLWNRTTDPLLFDIWDSSHPCDGQTNPVSDIGLRLAEGLHDLKLEEHLGPTREALGAAISTGATSFWKVADSVKSGISAQLEKREREKEAAREKGEGGLSSPSLASFPSFLSASSAGQGGTRTRESSEGSINLSPRINDASRAISGAATTAYGGLSSLWGRINTTAAANMKGKSPQASTGGLAVEGGDDFEVIVDLDAKVPPKVNEPLDLSSKPRTASASSKVVGLWG